MKLIVGNWKMNRMVKEAISLVTKLKKQLKDVKDIEIVVCPPFTALCEVNDIVKNSNIGLGAQDVFYEDKGAYTGEVSAEMLKDVGCSYVIIGHSERRQYFNETDEIVNKKVKKSLEFGLNVIVCVGENLEEREKGEHRAVVEKQVRKCLKGVKKEQMDNIIIAYEPRWAIGTGKTATPAQAQEMHSFIRSLLAMLFNEETAKKTKILYGGSVKPSNIKDLMIEKDIDGALVGGASLDAEKFVQIVKYK